MKTGASIAEFLGEKGLCVGEVAPEMARLGNEQRFRADAALPERIRAMLLDPACEVLVVTARPDEIAQCGLPYAKFGLAVVNGSLPEEVDHLNTTHVARILRGAVDRSTAGL